jgi:hypothetical protein
MIAFHSAENDIGFWNGAYSEPGSDVQNSIFAADCPGTWKTLAPQKFNSVRLSPAQVTNGMPDD